MTWEDMLKRKIGPAEDDRTSEARVKTMKRTVKQQQEADSEFASRTRRLFAKLGRQIDSLNISSKNKEDLDEFLDDLQELLELSARHYENQDSPSEFRDEVSYDDKKLRNFLADNSRKVSSKLDRFRRGE